MKIRTLMFAVAVAGTATGSQAQQSTTGSSIYTDLVLDRCKTVSQEEMGITLLCDGYRSYQVHFSEGDLRQSLFYGPVRQAILDEAFESFEPFNQVNTRIEWRTDPSGRPHATILRWILENMGSEGMPDDKSRGEVLVISRVAQPADGIGCVAGYVDARSNANANELARTVADTIAPGFDCGKSQPLWHGRRGEFASEPTHVWPESMSGQ